MESWGITEQCEKKYKFDTKTRTVREYFWLGAKWVSESTTWASEKLAMRLQRYKESKHKGGLKLTLKSPSKTNYKI